MRRLTSGAGLVLLSLGFFVALFPMISVWRVSGQVLNELPETPELIATDDRNRFALADEEFVLATRTYEATTVDAVRAAFQTRGFQVRSIDTTRWLTKACCGEYDAVLVNITDADQGVVVAKVTVADSDVQLSWPIFLTLGVLLAIPGAAILLVRSTPRSESRTERVGLAAASATGKRRLDEGHP